MIYVRAFLIAFLLVVNAFPGFCQDTEIDDENFVFSVKQIDEFMERFNRDKNTFLITYLNRKFPGQQAEKTDRYRYVINLFNTKNTFWDTTLVKEFAKEVTDTVHPIYINYSDNDWYALLQCKVLYKKRIRNLDLVLKTERAQNNSSKWVIVSAKADFLKFKSSYDSTKAPLPVYCGTDLRDSALENKYFLNPMAHGTDFMSVEEAFDTNGQFKNYLYAGLISEQINLLMQALKKHNLVFKYVTRVSYHFLQVPGWLFICENFNRNSHNSGWLISNLYKVNEIQKKIYLQQYLNVPRND